MNRAFLPALVALSLSVSTAEAQVFTTVIPTAFTAAEGNSSSSTLFQAGASSLQVMYTEAFLANAGIVPGVQLTGIAYRRNAAGTTGPASDTTMASYNILMSQSFTDLASFTTTFANNVVGTQTLVRTGSLTFPANSMPGGATPNAFGPIIDFSTDYAYSGGSLLIEVRRSARTGDTTAFNTDVDNSAASQLGVRWLFNLTSDSAATGTISNSAQIFQLQFTTAVPEPSTVAMIGLGIAASGVLYWQQRRRVAAWRSARLRR